jgi:hypothetical protein
MQKKAADVVYKLEARKESMQEVSARRPDCIPARRGTDYPNSPDIGTSSTVPISWQCHQPGSTSGLANSSSGEIRPLVQPPAVFGRALPATAPPIS